MLKTDESSFNKVVSNSNIKNVHDRRGYAASGSHCSIEHSPSTHCSIRHGSANSSNNSTRSAAANTRDTTAYNAAARNSPAHANDNW